tara:strand:- start:1355 stop:2188 length:834 start_codon:yes stop_codon:yes gene_type:complete
MRRLVVTISIFASALLVSCVSDDFGNIVEGFSPISPKQAALMAVDQYDADDRRTGITLLANSPFGGAPEYLKIYRDYVKNDHDPLVRAASIKALARFGNPEDAMLVVKWLNRSDEQSTQVRRAAAISLQRLHNPAVVPKLLRSLRDPDEGSQVRASVATALGQYPEDQVFMGLVASLQATDLAINLSGAQSLHTLTGQVFGTDWDAWFEWRRESVDAEQDIFAHMSVYEYPTYKHEARWWDRLTFWERRIHEKPDAPAGLKKASTRSTYDEEVDSTQ